MRAARLVRRLPVSHRVDVCPTASFRLVVATMAACLPVRSRTAVPCPAPDTNQSWSLAPRGRAVTSGPERVILAVHVRGIDGMCAGCRVWWSRLAPWPCWQVEWATSRLARASVARFLGGVR
ncbi:hypothetical protein [Salinispora arenicola]|uniref:hypothetical protein n=1 Tax=Salinispora arenicola TaxID=168697 RepID=UPI0003796D14|nr:hypothetical protein [Salinispora arenicola]